MMNKYLIFGWEAWEADGGMNDFCGFCDSIDDGKRLIEEKYEMGHIVDAKDFEIVIYGTLVKPDWIQGQKSEDPKWSWSDNL